MHFCQDELLALTTAATGSAAAIKIYWPRFRARVRSCFGKSECTPTCTTEHKPEDVTYDRVTRTRVEY